MTDTATAPRLTQRDAEGLTLLADHYAAAKAAGTDTYLRFSNVTLPPDAPGGPCLYWQTADRLASKGLAEKRGVAPNGLSRITPNGALLVLAHLAGWTIPADIGDPYVVNLCIETARERGAASGVAPEAIAARIDPLIDLIYPNA